MTIKKQYMLTTFEPKSWIKNDLPISQTSNYLQMTKKSFVKFTVVKSKIKFKKLIN